MSIKGANMSESELRECFRCQAANVDYFLESKNSVGSVWRISCRDCYVCSPRSSDKKYLADWWNTRPSSPGSEEVKRDLLNLINLVPDNLHANKNNYYGDSYEAYLSNEELAHKIDELVAKYSTPPPSESGDKRGEG